MLKFVIIPILLICVCKQSIKAAPVTESPFTDPELTGGFAGGDMIFGVNKNGLLDEYHRWPNREVFYRLVGDFDKEHRTAIRDAISILEAKTCVRFHEANDTTPHYVAISSQPAGCYSAVGYQRRIQEMNLQVYPIGEGCFRRGSIMHEFMHVLGFLHEHSSADRDDYVQVQYDNILENKEFNFRKYEPTEVTDFGVGYDYASCLHYGRKAFTRNGEDTMVPQQPNAEIGQRNGLSKKDIDKINVMYKCIIPL